VELGGRPPTFTHNAAVSTAWGHLLCERFGLATREQLRDQGLTDRTLQRRCRSGQRVFHGVYATTSGPLIRPALLTAALLYGGPYAMLSHRTAGEEWRMLAPETSMPVHITLPYGMSAVSQPAVPGQYGVLHPAFVVHRSRAYRNIVVSTEPPRISCADTVLDMAVAEPTAQQAGDPGRPSTGSAGSYARTAAATARACPW